MPLFRSLLLSFFISSVYPQTQDLIEKSLRAKQAMASKNFDEAIRLYQQLSRALPDNAGLRMNLALALHSSGRSHEAIPLFQSVLRQKPGMQPARLMLALAYQKIDQPGKAIPELKAFLRADPTNETARLELGDALLKSGQAEEAAEEFRQITATSSDSAKAWQGLGLTYVSISRRAFDNLEALDSASVYCDVLFARSLVSSGRYAAAFATYRQAMAKSQAVPGIHAGLAEVYRATGHGDWAGIEDSRERALPATDCTTVSLECLYNSGKYSEVLSAAKQIRSAESYYWQSLASSKLADQAFDRLSRMPPSPVTYDLLADASRVQSRFGAAATEWEKALQLAPDDRRLKKNLAVALSLSGKHERAGELFRQLIAVEPQWPDLNFQFGAALIRAGMVEEAVGYLQTAARLAPENARAQASLGSALFQLDRLAEAIPHLKAALSSDEDGSVHYHLGQAYVRTGQRELAITTLRGFNERSKAAPVHRKPAEQEITPP
jgi:tetratricopeptide (TPR) repeat protein